MPNLALMKPSHYFRVERGATVNFTRSVRRIGVIFRNRDFRCRGDRLEKPSLADSIQRFRFSIKSMIFNSILLERAYLKTKKDAPPPHFGPKLRQRRRNALNKAYEFL